MAGRKSLRDEVIQANVINLSWTTILRALKSSKLNAREKRNIALEIVKKTCPQQIQGEVKRFEEIKITVSVNGQKDSKDRLDVTHNAIPRVELLN